MLSVVSEFSNYSVFALFDGSVHWAILIASGLRVKECAVERLNSVLAMVGSSDAGTTGCLSHALDTELYSLNCDGSVGFEIKIFGLKVRLASMSGAVKERPDFYICGLNECKRWSTSLVP